MASPQVTNGLSAAAIFRGAHELLVIQDAAVGHEVGYESEAAFSRAFKKLVGVSPAVWREARG